MEWIQLIISMIGVIGLILFMFFLLKKVNKRTAIVGGNKLKIIDRATLGRDSVLAVVSVCGKLMLIGVSSGRMEKICDLTATEEEYLNNGGSTAVGTPGFMDILTNMGIKRRTKPNDEINFGSFGGSENGTDEDNDIETGDKTE